MDEQSCRCLLEPLEYDRYLPLRFVGIDPAQGRFGEVNIWQCKTCRRLWLHYLIEEEAFTASGRFFMGLIAPADAAVITAGAAWDYLQRLEWHLYGGSYFGGKGKTTRV